VQLPYCEYSRTPRYSFDKKVDTLEKGKFADFKLQFARKSEVVIPKLKELVAKESFSMTIETGGAGPKTVKIEFKYGCMYHSEGFISPYISLGVAKIGLFKNEQLYFPENDEFSIYSEDRLKKVRKILNHMSQKMDNIYHGELCPFS